MEEKNNHILLEIGTAPYLLKSMQKDKLKKVDIKEDWICLVSIHLDFLHNRGYFVFTDRKTLLKFSFSIESIMESAIVSLANKYLSTYIKGLNPTDLSLSILKGKIALRNVVRLLELIT